MAIFIHLSSLPCPCKLAVLYIKYINTEILKPKRKGFFGVQALLSDVTDCLGFLYFEFFPEKCHSRPRVRHFVVEL